MKRKNNSGSLFFEMLLTVVILTMMSCGQSVLITRTGEQPSKDNITIDQFSREKSGKYFSLMRTDSAVMQIKFIGIKNDSILYMLYESNNIESLSLEAVEYMEYRQDDRGFHALVGGFTGLFGGALLGASQFDLKNSNTSIAAFSFLITTTVTGAVVGYHTGTNIRYTMPHRHTASR